MKRLILCVALLGVCTPALAQYPYPVYRSPAAAIRWQYRMAYGPNPAVVRRQIAYRRWMAYQNELARRRAWRQNPEAMLRQRIQREAEREVQRQLENQQFGRQREIEREVRRQLEDRRFGH